MDKTVSQTVRDNEITITTEPIPSGEYFYRHYISAEIHSGEIELRVRSVLLGQNRVQLPNRPPQSVPDNVHRAIRAALTGGR